jgi:Domain of unknown function (DUF4402)
MKQTSKFIALAIVLIAFCANSFSQSATATATATIITPIAISKTVDMVFGNISPTAVSGTVVLSPAGARTPTNCTVAGGGATAASFNVTGSGTLTYAITLPGSTTLVNGGNNMIADTFTSTPSGTGALTAGAQTLTVGATLHVGASQVAGTYVSANFTVTVGYN